MAFFGGIKPTLHGSAWVLELLVEVLGFTIRTQVSETKAPGVQSACSQALKMAIPAYTERNGVIACRASEGEFPLHGLLPASRKIQLHPSVILRPRNRGQKVSDEETTHARTSHS